MIYVLNFTFLGVDMQPGREGGTWFGMSTKGKIACLLSILSPGKWKKSKKGRGLHFTKASP